MQNKVGVGPHPQPWPSDPRYDPLLLKEGDTRNVADKYRYWTVDAIKNDLDAGRVQLEVAVENIERDFNMGTIIRNANAFNVSKVHVVGSRQWNKRGAMKTDAYLTIEYHQTPIDFFNAMKDRHREVIAIDIVEGAKVLQDVQLPENAVLIFGAEGPGLSKEILEGASEVVMIKQAGSTRSVNVGVASGIAMFAWDQQHRK